MASIRVRVYPTSIAPHLSQIYAGLIELHHARKIRLEVADKLSRPLPEVHEHLLWTEIHSDEHPLFRTVCFDMRDGGQTIAEDAAEASDIYFKRSFDPAYIKQLPTGLRGKVQPYGLNYACRSGHMRKTLEIQRIHRRIEHRMKRHGSHSSMALIAKHMTSLLISSKFRIHVGSLYLPKDFETSPNQSTERKILFLTRAWESTAGAPEDTNKFKMLNDMRANTVRALRQYFGKRFIGGLQDTPFARKNYSDCIATHNTSKRHYLSLVRRCLVAVTTTGLHGSTGWKLPEYLAASRCIVTEPLLYDLPVPLVDDVNLITFSTPEQCVNACERLLEDQSLAVRMRVSNFTYYNAEINPSALMLNRIRDVLGKDSHRSFGHRTDRAHTSSPQSGHKIPP